MKNCIFCKIVKGEMPATKLYENKQVLVFMDIKPVNQGHLLIIPKKHAELINEVDQKVSAEMFRLAKIMNSAVRSSGLKCEGVNFFLADGESAGQEIFHTHLHVIPRFKKDGFGFRFPKDYKVRDRKELEKIAQKIKLPSH